MNISKPVRCEISVALGFFYVETYLKQALLIRHIPEYKKASRKQCCSSLLQIVNMGDTGQRTFERGDTYLEPYALCVHMCVI